MYAFSFVFFLIVPCLYRSYNLYWIYAWFTAWKCLAYTIYNNTTVQSGQSHSKSQVKSKVIKCLCLLWLDIGEFIWLCVKWTAAQHIFVYIVLVLDSLAPISFALRTASIVYMLRAGIVYSISFNVSCGLFECAHKQMNLHLLACRLRTLYTMCKYNYFWHMNNMLCVWQSCLYICILKTMRSN